MTGGGGRDGRAARESMARVSETIGRMRRAAADMEADARAAERHRAERALEAAQRRLRAAWAAAWAAPGFFVIDSYPPGGDTLEGECGPAPDDPSAPMAERLR